MNRVLLSLTAFFLLLGTLGAHPVAQGSMEFDLREDHLAVRARISNEQVFVASTFDQAAAANGDLPAMFRAHGNYLLNHLEVRDGNGNPLQGAVARVTPPTDLTVNGFAIYDLRYALHGEAARPISVKQDFLRGFEFAPGTRWTATFTVSQRVNGQPAREGLLLTHTDPLALAFATGGATLDRGQLFWDYLHHGMTHILEGWDHLLFMAALVLAATSLWELVKVVTAFTVAHTLTLALSTFELVRLPSSIVEPMIALSIVIVAVQNVLYPATARGPGRLLVAFAFGLFHGLGFAGGLLEAMEGMTAGATTIALAGFSVGVELGHQVVVIPLFIIMVLLRRSATPGPAPISAAILRYSSVLIAIAGCTYFGLALRG